jgi:hypothetical protein
MFYGEGRLPHIHLAIAALVELPREELLRVDLVVFKLVGPGRSLSEFDARQVFFAGVGERIGLVAAIDPNHALTP